LDASGRTEFWVATEICPDAETTSPVPVGCIGLRHGSDGSADIGRFAVDVAFRGRGLARMLLGAVEVHAERAGFKGVTARCSCGDAHSHSERTVGCTRLLFF
jgi:ribosomal protein S18 acetylase RimI-like enzyme